MRQNRESRNKFGHRRVQRFNKDAKKAKWGTNCFFNKWCWENGTFPCKGMKVDHVLMPYTYKKLSKFRLETKLRTESMKLLEDKIH